MPNLKYSGSKGVVQSTGTGQFHVITWNWPVPVDCTTPFEPEYLRFGMFILLFLFYQC